MARTAFETPENLWEAIKKSREWRIAVERAESDQKEGVVRLVNEDAYPDPEE